MKEHKDPIYVEQEDIHHQVERKPEKDRASNRPPPTETAKQRLAGHRLRP
jgi:hypothetical protein